MKLLLFYFSIFASLTTMGQTIHQFQVEDITGATMDLAQFKGKKIFIVNVASACGYTSQYKQLQELYEKHGDKLVVIGFPCNDFGGQEKGSNEKIQEFCSSKFGVTFPMTTKINIKGDEAHPIYQWLTQKEKNGVMDTKVKWNFTKFLLDEEGKLIRSYPSSTSPTDAEILDWVQS